MFFLPPRHGKSELTSVRFPAWVLGKTPSKRIIHSSYSALLSTKFSRQTRDLVNDKRHKIVFPDSNLSKDTKSSENWETTEGGGMIASGVGGSTTGFGADIFVIDDPVKNQQEAESETFRSKVWEWYRSVVRTRLEPKAAQVLIMTRWHKHDLAGKILEDQDDWDIVHLPAIADHKVNAGPDLLNREQGAALWSYRYDEKVLENTKHDVGSRVWFALYQGSPKDPESQVIHREWIRWYDALPPETKRTAGIDTATSKKTSADNMAMVDACKDKEGYIYVDDALCEKLSVSSFAKHVVAQQAAKKYQSIWFELNNAGEAVKQRVEEVAREETVSVPIKGVQTTTDKVVRVMEFQALIENGTVRFNRNNPRVIKLVDHLVDFDGKGGEVDDDVDALGFAIKAHQKKRVAIHDL
jgi:predicted phage terminase large subunit-like protein